MTATSEKYKSNGAPPDRLRPPTLAAPRAQRRPAFVVAGITLAALGALAVMWLVASAGHRIEVVMMARDVPYGATLTAQDLTTTDVSVEPNVSVVGAAHTDDLVGKVATTNLARGSLLAHDDVTTGGVVEPNEVVVPLPLPAERVPAGGLAAGDRLLVVDAPPLGADPVVGAPSSFDARVVAVGPPDVNGALVADVASPAEVGKQLAIRAATGRFAIVVLSPQETP